MSEGGMMSEGVTSEGGCDARDDVGVDEAARGRAHRPLLSPI